MKKHLFILFGLLIASPAHSAIQTITGSNFDLIYDDTKLGFFWRAKFSWQQHFFTPNNFKAESLNGSGIVTSNSIINDMQLVAKNGFRFVPIDVTEFGDYLMRGPESFVSVSGQLRAFNGAYFAAINTAASLIVSANTPLSIIDGLNHDWQASESITNTTASKFGLTGWLSSSNIVNITV